MIEFYKLFFNMNLDSHSFNHNKSKLTFKPDFPELGIELQNSNKILRKWLPFMLDH